MSDQPAPPAPAGEAAEPPAAPAPGGDRHPTADQDSPWKEALDRWLDAFALLLFPALHAVLADGDPAWRPSVHARERAGCRLRFEFPVAKLLDWDTPEARDALESSRSPAAVVVLAQLDALRTRRRPRARQAAKWALYRGLFGRGLSREAILELFRVLDWLLALPPSLERELAARITRFEEEVRMPYVTSVERIGREKGLEEGLEEGVLRGRHETLRLIVSTRWGAPSSSLDERLRAAVAGPDFAAVASQATSAPSLEAFAAWLSARDCTPG